MFRSFSPNFVCYFRNVNPVAVQGVHLKQVNKYMRVYDELEISFRYRTFAR